MGTSRMAEFVTKSIDNLSHGLTVRSAMKTLGLKEWVVRSTSVDVLIPDL